MTAVIDDEKVVWGVIFPHKLPDLILKVRLWTPPVIGSQRHLEGLVIEAIFEKAFEPTSL